MVGAGRWKFEDRQQGLIANRADTLGEREVRLAFEAVGEGHAGPGVAVAPASIVETAEIAIDMRARITPDRLSGNLKSDAGPFSNRPENWAVAPQAALRYDRPMDERDAVKMAKKLKPETLARIDALHRKWLLDSEIAGRMRLEPLVVWHARQLHGIDRHKAP